MTKHELNFERDFYVAVDRVARTTPSSVVVYGDWIDSTPLSAIERLLEAEKPIAVFKFNPIGGTSENVSYEIARMLMGLFSAAPDMERKMSKAVFDFLRDQLGQEEYLELLPHFGEQQ